MGQLAGKVALVTGAGASIGKASAILFAREGAQVAALANEQEEVEKAVEEIRGVGGDALALVADVASAEQMEAAITQVVKTWGRLDVVYANAGINGVWAPLEELTLEEWTRTLTTNLTGTFLTMKYATPYLKRQGGVALITSSVNGTRIFSNTGATAYSCSKAGQVAFAKMTALELARWNVRVNVICPGAIATDIGKRTEQRHVDTVKVPVEYPQGRMPLTGEPGEAEDVARLALFLASDAAKHISGTEMWIDAAESLLVG